MAYYTLRMAISQFAGVVMKKKRQRKSTAGQSRQATLITITDRPPPGTDFYQSVAELLRTARARAYRAVNFTMVEAYWNVGRMIVEEEQYGLERARYGAELIKNLSYRLTKEFGKSFTETNLKYFRQFYLAFPAEVSSGIRHTLCDELTWSHYRILMRVEKSAAREWYLKEAAAQNWSTRALERQINSFYYERLSMSRDEGPVIEEMQQKAGPLALIERSINEEEEYATLTNLIHQWKMIWISPG